MEGVKPLAFEEIDAGLQDMLRPTVDRLGYFGAFFQYASHAPEVLTGFMRLSGALKAALPDDINETIALTVCTAMDFSYERIQHERLSEKLGLDRAWIAFLTGLGPQLELSDAQDAARDLSLAVVEGRYSDAQSLTARLANMQSPAAAMAMLFQATRFMQICAIGKTLDMELGLPSIFAALERG